MEAQTFLTPVLACSGPSAAATIDKNFWLSLLWTVPALLFVLGTWKFHLRLGGKFSLCLLTLSLFLLLVHPAWTISAMIGDCGQAKLAESKNFAFYISAIFLLQLFIFWRRNSGLKKA